MTGNSETYWNDLLEQYKTGTISAEDQFRLEKRALDDPFLFDALEGLSLVAKSAEDTKPKTKLLTLPRMAAAASLVFLVAMVFLLKNDGKQDSSSQESIAMVLENENGDTNDSKTDDIVEVQEEEENITEEIQEGENAQNPNEVTSTNAPQTSKVNTSKRPQSKTEVKNTTETTFKKENTPLQEPTKELENATPNASESQTEVVSATNAAAPTSARSFESGNSSTKLEIEEVISEEVADVNSDTPLKKTKEKIKEEIDNTFYKVEPAIGKKDFEEFVRESIDNRGLRQNPPKKVTIEFNIDANGELSDFSPHL